MAYVKSVNGYRNSRASSSSVARGVLIPRVVNIDASDILLSNGKTIEQAMKAIAPMQAVKISGTTDDYTFDLGNGGFFV